MAVRSVFLYSDGKCFRQDIEFLWHGGLSLVQKQKNVRELHQQFLEMFPQNKVIEISTASELALGRNLSAFNLRDEFGLSVESKYQASKIFEHGGPYLDILSSSSLDAKKDSRLKTSGRITGFFFEGRHFSKQPRTLVYNWIYISTLLKNPNLAKEILNYDSFTDLFYNPDKGKSCQADSLVIYITLHKLGLLEKATESIDTFSKYVYGY